MRSVCIAVDDFGLHRGINLAALQLATAGRVHAIGCMVAGPAWLQGGPTLRGLDRDNVDLGLHLDLTETPWRSFAVRPLWRLMLDCWSHRIDRVLLRTEIRRQLDAFRLAIGRLPDYVDGHQHVHQFPVVRDILIDELCRGNGSERPWIRSTRSPRGRLSSGDVRVQIKSRIIGALGARELSAIAQANGFRQNQALLGVYDFPVDTDDYAIHLRRWLAGACTGDLLMCHPSLAFEGPDPIIRSRMAEFEVLSGTGARQLLDEAGIVLQPMSRILNHASA